MPCFDIAVECSKGSKVSPRGLVNSPCITPTFSKEASYANSNTISVVARMYRGSPPGANATAQLVDMHIGTLVFTLNDNKFPVG